MARKRRRRRRKQMKFVQWFKSLKTSNKVLLVSGTVLTCLLITGVIVLACLVGDIWGSRKKPQNVEQEEIVANELDENVGKGYTNFAVFGGDSREGDLEKDLNTDTIIIVSLNNETKEVKLVSVYRDTLLDVSNGNIQKCNSAYIRGGANAAVNMLNRNLDLDIKKYVTVDFTAVVDLIDMIGGVEVDVSEAERKAVNKYINETGSVAGKKAKHLTKSGVQLLDGVQATTYARIRKGVGDDFARTERQRLIITKIVEKTIQSDLSTITKIAKTLFGSIYTNFELTEVLSYAKDFKKYSISETTGFPFKKGSGTIPKKGDSVFPITLKSNVSQLHEFLYGTEDYEPSAKVVEISNEIAYIVGNRKPDNDSGSSSGGGTGSDTGTEPEDGTDTGTEPEDGTDTGTEPGDGSDTGTEPGDGSDTGTEPGDGSDTGTEPGDGSDTGTEPGDGSDTGTEPGDGSDTGTEPGDGSDTGTESGDGSDTGTGGGTNTGNNTGTGGGSDAGTGTNTGTNP